MTFAHNIAVNVNLTQSSPAVPLIDACSKKRQKKSVTLTWTCGGLVVLMDQCTSGNLLHVEHRPIQHLEEAEPLPLPSSNCMDRTLAVGELF